MFINFEALTVRNFHVVLLPAILDNMLLLRVKRLFFYPERIHKNHKIYMSCRLGFFGFF